MQKNRQLNVYKNGTIVATWFSAEYFLFAFRHLKATAEMSRSGCMNIITRDRIRRAVLVGLLFLAFLNSVNSMPYKRSMIRLCSKNLSDALHLTCKDRGYNELLSYSFEEDPPQQQTETTSMRPGLTEECCYRTCTYAQLEQYCKPLKTTPATTDAVKNQVWIEKNRYPSARPAASSSSEERSRSDIDYVHRAVKCRIHGSKEARRKGFSSEHGDDAVGGCDDKRNSTRRHCAGHGCKHQRQRRRRLDKVFDRILADRVLNNKPVVPNAK
ncbi:insulin-like growth factor I [Ceratina calcarata]|uniref:Insulin-like growth factor I n=1 Tax=Ceratina calcarata TaxID=156304 RepID=A0AAJ7NG08_9HYME|nr:insulin-like growth factor I [Ceratina calcarata]